jgi:hypothetical protein
MQKPFPYDIVSPNVLFEKQKLSIANFRETIAAKVEEIG